MAHVPDDSALDHSRGAFFAVTPSQTVGPYFAIGLPFEGQEFVVPEGTPGAITITGTIYDGHGDPIPDHVLETWQPDGDGKFADAHGHGGRSQLDGFRGWGRWCVADGDGSYRIHTVKPGSVPFLDGSPQAPHIDVTVMARGMLNRVVTRIYFADEGRANGADPVLTRVPANRRQTLIAEPTADGYRFDIRIQGPGETVFFDI